MDLPQYILDNLYLQAKQQGKSLKSYMESALQALYNPHAMKEKESPSPSEDPWFDDPRNLEMLNRSIQQAQNGECETFSCEELIKELEP